MHPNPVFHTRADAHNLKFAQARGFGVLTINGDDGPLVSHIPFLLRDEGRVMEAHLVRSNPILRQIGEGIRAVCAVSGVDGYISPDWYGVPDQVPTWNYVAVHLRGVLRRLPDAELLGVLERVSARMEAPLAPKTPWTIDKMDSDVFARMTRMIVPVTLEIETVQGTWKLSQNKPDEVRMAAADQVAEAELARMMRAPDDV